MSLFKTVTVELSKKRINKTILTKYVYDIMNQNIGNEEEIKKYDTQKNNRVA